MSTSLGAGNPDINLAFVLVALITLACAPGYLRLERDDAGHVSHHRPQRGRTGND